MKLKRYILFVLFAFFSQWTAAQETLSLDDAIRLALNNNYGIKIQNNNSEITKNNVNYGNAGFLPSLSGNLSTGGGKQTSTQTASTGIQRTINGAANSNLSYGASLGWTIFDGFQMFTNYEKLKELQLQGEVNVRATILSTVSNVINGYFDLARQQKLIVATDSAMEISRYRLRISNNKLEIGRGSKLDVLTAQVDYNADTSAYLQQKNTAQQLMVNLNRLIARDPNIMFQVDKEVKINGALEYSSLLASASTINPEIQNAVISNRLTELNLKYIKGARFPVVGVNTGYNFNRSATPTGFNQRIRSRGLTYGLTASINIFNGFLQKQNERNAKIEIATSKLQLEEARENVTASLLGAYKTYLTSLDLLKLETGNVDIARENLDITLEKYRLGSISTLDVRDAQVRYINAVTRYVDAEYQAKLNEITLKEISGTLNIEQ